MNPTQAIMSALERDRGGIAVVWCPDLGLRAWLADEIAGLVDPGAAPLRTSSVDEAIATPHRIVFLMPNDERAMVEELDGRREQLLAEPTRTQSVVLFLLRDGDGRIALAKAPSLSGWVRGSDVDPDELAEVHVSEDRARFEATTGQTVEDWLIAWRAGTLPHDGETLSRAYWAALLESQ